MSEPAPLPARAFLDSNVLVYAASIDEPEKQAKAHTLIERLVRTRGAVISTQVLNEFSSVALRTLKISPPNVRALVETHCRMEVVIVTPDIIREAIDIHQTRQLNYYDALMVASAKIAGCAVLYTEDMSGGARVNQVKLVNPFSEN
jgi:predicted nucleic acid-binding protein